MGPDGSLSRGQAALDRGDWSAARRALTEELVEEESAEALYGLARVVEHDGDFREAIGLYERSYAAYRARAETRMPALIAARELSFLYLAVHGNEAAAAGWLLRARRLAAASGPCVEAGWVELACALSAADAATEAAHTREAARLARSLGDSDLELCAVAYEGHCLVRRGQVSDGMRLVDEAAAAAAGGEVGDYLAAGEIYCKMLLCCEITLDVRRAQQWMTVAEQLDRRENAVWLSAICRMHYGGILTAAGRWAEAESELSRSLRRYGTTYPGFRSGAVVRLADLRLRQGRWEEAARLLDGCEADGDAALPLARLHLARGEVDSAAAVLRRRLREQGEGMLSAPVMALLVEVELAAGRADAARDVAHRMASVASTTEQRHVRGLAEYAAGLAGAASGDPGARQCLESAADELRRSGLPLEEGRARLAVARLLADSQPWVAVTEAKHALSLLDRLPARPDADEAALLLRRLGWSGRPAPRAAGELTHREAQVLRLVTEGLTNPQIGERLFISRRTVEHHVGSIFAKLQVSSRAEALALVLRHAP